MSTIISKKNIYLTGVIFFLSLPAVLVANPPLNEKQQEIFNQAQRFLETLAYKEAIVSYQELIEEIQEKDIPSDQKYSLLSELHYRQAEAQFLNRNYSAVLEMTKKDMLFPFSADLTFLHALAYKKLGQLNHAIDSFQSYLSFKQAPLKHHREALFEMGLVFFQLNQSAKAKTLFEEISEKKENFRLYFLSQLYLVRIALLEGDCKEAEKKLSSLDFTSLEKPDPLRYEQLFLQGELFFQLRDYEKAANAYEQALPQQNATFASWYVETLYHLATCYMKMGDDPNQERKLQEKHLDRAETLFQQLLNTTVNEEIYLSLGQCYLIKARRLNDEKALHQAEEVLSKPGIFVSQAAQTQALFLRAESAPSFTIREKFYHQLTREFPHLAQGWLSSGTNDFEEGERLALLQQTNEANRLFSKAIASFEKAFVLLENDDLNKKALILKYQMLAYLKQDTEKADLQAIALFEKNISHHPELINNMSPPDELFYLASIAALHLAEKTGNNEYVLQAEKILKEMKYHFKEGSLMPDTQYLIGSFYFQQKEFAQAEKHFVSLATDYPFSKLAADALFFASRAAEALQKDLAVIQSYRRQVFTNYPQTPYAAEAYFSLYSFSDYLNDNRAALQHLQAMPLKYPQSPFLIPAYYLLGLHHKKSIRNTDNQQFNERSLHTAIEAFQEAESSFDALEKKNLIQKDQLEFLITIRYRSALERAAANLAIAEMSKGAKKEIYCNYAKELFQQLVHDIEDPQHILNQSFKNSNSHIRLLEEGKFGLAQAYLKANNDTAAEAVLSEMIEKYQTAKITRGYFLSRTWYEQGLIAMRRGNYTQALQLLDFAENAAKGQVLSTDQKLEIWLQQSHCYRMMNQLDTAMLTLSKIINADVVSTLRLKAMYLRAEIYHRQERKELAQRQLESLKKMGGEWAEKAKEKLNKEYRYE